MTMEPFGADGVRTGPTYEGDREATRARLSAVADDRRVELGGDLVLVFEPVDSVRTALEELLRAERIADPPRLDEEAAAFGALTGGSSALAAILFVDVADPVALGDRLAELPGIAERVFLDLRGTRIPARPQPGDDSSGAFHLLFALDASQRAALLDDALLAIVVDHPGCRTTVALSASQVRAAAIDLRR